MAVRPAQGGGSPELGKRKGAAAPPELGKKVKGGGGTGVGEEGQGRRRQFVFLLQDCSLAILPVSGTVGCRKINRAHG
jgi:hypothetical protein